MGAMDSHYDEFGNYIGPELSDESDSSSSDEDEEKREAEKKEEAKTLTQDSQEDDMEAGSEAIQVKNQAVKK